MNKLDRVTAGIILFVCVLCAFAGTVLIIVETNKTTVWRTGVIVGKQRTEILVGGEYSKWPIYQYYLWIDNGDKIEVDETYYYTHQEGEEITYWIRR